jgi:transcriptional regulator with XRE-family HTH domain
MTLDHWLTLHKRSAEDFGKELGCSGQAVRHWRLGARSPDAEMLEKIVAATAGEVTVLDMHQTRLAFLKGESGEAIEEASREQARFFRRAAPAAE